MIYTEPTVEVLLFPTLDVLTLSAGDNDYVIPD